MKYISTRNPDVAVSGSTAVLTGLAPDGGLYVPESYPTVTIEQIESLADLDYPERSARIMSLFFDELSYDELLSITRRACAVFAGGPAPPAARPAPRGSFPKSTPAPTRRCRG